MDSILVRMPDDLYQFLQAMAVIQDYSVQIAVGAQRGQREGHYQFTFRMDEKFKYFEPCLRVVHDNIPIFDYSGWDEEQRGEYDCFIRFDDNMFQRAKKLCSVMGTHITSGLNTLIGAGAGLFPVLKPLQLKPVEDSVDVLILPWNNVEAEKFYEFVLNNYPDIEMILDTRDFTEFTPGEIVEYVNSFRCVIGPVGVCTYLSVIMKKVTAEIFPTSEDGRLYGVAGAPRYWAVVGQKTTAEFLWLQWEEKLCPELMSETNNQQEQTSKEIQASIAVNVGEKSGDKPTPRLDQ